MANVIRLTAVWTGAPGLPGYSQFYVEVTGDVATQSQQGHDSVRGFFDALTAYLPEEVTVTVDPLYDVVNLATGALVAEGTVGTPSAAVEGAFVGGWNAQVGVLIEWITSAIIDGRHVKGRTYLVPLGDVSDVDGTLPAATSGDVWTAGGQITGSAAAFVVWHRPVNGAGGQVSTIQARLVRDHACMLRSRMN